MLIKGFGEGFYFLRERLKVQGVVGGGLDTGFDKAGLVLDKDVSFASYPFSSTSNFLAALSIVRRQSSRSPFRKIATPR